jgi:hypothetical protein
MIDQELQKELIEIWSEDEGYDFPGFEIIEGDGEWEVDGKYQNRLVIVKYKEKFYSISEYRTGSYYSDYDYGEPIFTEVEPREVTITKIVYKEVK